MVVKTLYQKSRVSKSVSIEINSRLFACSLDQKKSPIGYDGIHPVRFMCGDATIKWVTLLYQVGISQKRTAKGNTKITEYLVTNGELSQAEDRCSILLEITRVTSNQPASRYRWAASGWVDTFNLSFFTFPLKAFDNAAIYAQFAKACALGKINWGSDGINHSYSAQA